MKEGRKVTKKGNEGRNERRKGGGEGRKIKTEGNEGRKVMKEGRKEGYGGK